MYHTTGFTKAEITGLCARMEARELSPRMRRWPPVPGLRNALTVTLTYLRRNRVQAERVPGMDLRPDPGKPP